MGIRLRRTDSLEIEAFFNKSARYGLIALNDFDEYWLWMILENRAGEDGGRLIALYRLRYLFAWRFLEKMQDGCQFFQQQLKNVLAALLLLPLMHREWY